MNNLQAVVYAMSEGWAKERSELQLTLGELIKFLKAQPSDFLIEGLGELDSYRGYYRDLAFEPVTTQRSVENLLAECQLSMGKVFKGYKGGDYLMGENTPLWVANYGSCGTRLMGVDGSGGIQTSDESD